MAVRRLADLCIDALAQRPDRLYLLSQVELVELTCRVCQGCSEATGALATAEAQLARLRRSGRPAVDPGQYEYSCLDLCRKRRAVAEKWRVTAQRPAMAAFPPERLVPVWDWGEARVQGYGPWRDVAYLSNVECVLHRLISSPLLWYRLCCVFDTPTAHRGSLKDAVWEYYVEHKASGARAGFGDRERGARLWVDAWPPSGRPSFDEDWLELLELLLDECCPRPHDDVVAGSIRHGGRLSAW